MELASILMIVLAFVCFILTAIIGRKFIPVLKSIKMGQKILDIGPRWHKSKEGTPTMGGLFFIVPVMISLVAAAVILKEYGLLIHALFILLNGAIGFVDDYVKFFKKQNAGLTPSQKMFTVCGSGNIYFCPCCIRKY